MEKAIKSCLRKFFSKVHPDRFHNYPELQKINQRSFQELMSFLDDTQSATRFLRSLKVYDLHFYYRKDDRFKEVRMSFKLDSSLLFDDQRRRQYAVQCILKLLQACEIEVPLSDEFQTGTEFRQYDELRSDLLQWLRENVEKSRQIQQQYEAESQQIESLRSQLSRLLNLHNLYISCFVEQSEALQALQNLLNHVERLQCIDMQGVRLHIGRKYDLDDSGTLIIPFNFEINTCIRFIEENLHTISEKVQAWENLSQKVEYLRKQLVNKLSCHAIGLSSFCTYEQIYQCLLQLENCYSQLKEFNLTNIYFMIGDKFNVTDTGIFYIPYNFEIKQLKKYLQENLTRARQLQQQQMALEQEIETLIDHIQNELNLDYLGYSVTVSEQECLDCLKRMLEAMDVLRTLSLDGLKVSISNRFGLRDNGTIEIKHDFALETLKNFLPQEKIRLKGGND